MAKDKNKTTSTTNTTTEIPTEVSPEMASIEIVPTDIPVETPVVIEQGIAKVSESAIEISSKSWVDDIPKPIRMMLEVMPPVEPEEMSAMIDQLPDQQRTNFEDVIAKMNPVKAGVISSDARFQLFDARIYHGVGDDAGRPSATPVGSIYTADGRVLACWDKQQAKQLKTGQTFIGAVVGLQETRAWWKPRDKNYTLPPEVDPNSNAPICVSLDRKRGKRYGPCPACPHRPYANGKYDNNSCHDEIKMYIVLRDFTGIYSMTLKGASIKNGVQPVRRLINASTTPWDRWLEFGLAEEKNTQGRWFSLTGAAHTDDDNPQGVMTNAAERGVLSVLARTVLNEVYRPALQAIYTVTPQSAAAVDSGADMAAIINAAAGPAADYSKNNL